MEFFLLKLNLYPSSILWDIYFKKLIKIKCYSFCGYFIFSEKCYAVHYQNIIMLFVRRASLSDKLAEWQSEVLFLPKM